MSNVLGNCQECGEMKPCDCGFGGFNADADPTPAEALKAEWRDERPTRAEIVDEAIEALRDDLRSIPGAGDAQREIVAWLRRQSDLGANRGNDAGKGSTKRAAFGGGSLALARAADAIESGDYRTNDNALSPPDAGEVRTYREGVEASAALVDQAEQMYRGGSGGSYKECRRNQCELIAAAIRKLP